MSAILTISLRIPVLFLFLLTAIAGASASIPAAGPRDELIVTTTWLRDHLKDPNLVLLHVGDPAEYKAKHLPGAQFVELMDISAPMDHSPNADPKVLSLELPDPAALRDRLTKLGISNTSTIVVYYGSTWYSPTTRVIFTLNFAGLGAQTKLLDGGMRAWVAAELPTTTEISTVKPGTLGPLKTVDSVVDAAFIQSKKPGTVVIDARDKIFYDGTQSGGDRNGPPVLGHIPGAGSIPFGDVFDDKGIVEPAATLAELFKQAGVKTGDEVIAYCHIGQQATAVVFAARTLGYKVRLYDGSMNDWTLRGLPVQKER
ncbi:MAG TPA: rhodanese-like domain-containing protein [Vicinamibacterales bacterium]|nr:rhodanese-like domain-containing protein [Vicinamibacterales bacterium]